MMSRYSRRGGVLVLGFWLALTMIILAAEAAQIRAKIGIRIQSDAQVTLAKAYDRVHMGDQLRLYIVPETQTYTYVIHTDHKKVQLLYQEHYVPDFKGHQPIRFPSEPQREYTIDGQSSLEEFIIICSPIELVYIANLFESPEASYERWKLIEDKLMEKSSIKLSETSDKPFVIAGNVRSMEETFLQQLQIFSGQEFLVKKYAFRVKK
jgi:hypothetical protein